jgi:hypothetical protein
MLLRYRPQLLEDEALRRIWENIDEQLLRLPNTFHEEWTSATEGPYQNSMGFLAVTRLGLISCMIKQHDKYPLDESGTHAVACLESAAAAFLSSWSAGGERGSGNASST